MQSNPQIGAILFYKGSNNSSSDIGFSDSGQCIVKKQEGPDTWKIKLVGSGDTLVTHVSCLSPMTDLGPRSRKKVIDLPSSAKTASRRASNDDEDDNTNSDDDVWEHDENYQRRKKEEEKEKKKDSPVFVLDEPGKHKVKT